MILQKDKFTGLVRKPLRLAMVAESHVLYLVVKWPVFASVCVRCREVIVPNHHHHH